jgi:hypothetical protein
MKFCLSQKRTAVNSAGNSQAVVGSLGPTVFVNDNFCMNLYKNLQYLHPDKKREASASLERFQFEVGSILNYYSTRLPYT